jgi:putative tryptophan/tyrosine transport system substrate-binding protein
MRSVAAELVGLEPHVIVTRNVAATRALLQQTRNIPIIFAGVGGDPVAAGLVGSIARPDRNATGFTNSYYSIGGKWLELLKGAAEAKPPDVGGVSGALDLLARSQR